MNNVEIHDTKSTNYGRFVFIENYSQSYNSRGKKLKANSTDGLCDTVTIKNNFISPLPTFKAYGVYEKTNTTKQHSNVIKKNNVTI